MGWFRDQVDRFMDWRGAREDADAERARNTNATPGIYPNQSDVDRDPMLVRFMLRLEPSSEAEAKQFEEWAHQSYSRGYISARSNEEISRNPAPVAADAWQHAADLIEAGESPEVVAAALELATGMDKSAEPIHQDPGMHAPTWDQQEAAALGNLDVGELNRWANGEPAQTEAEAARHYEWTREDEQDRANEREAERKENEELKDSPGFGGSVRDEPIPYTLSPEALEATADPGEVDTAWANARDLALRYGSDPSITPNRLYEAYTAAQEAERGTDAPEMDMLAIAQDVVKTQTEARGEEYIPAENHIPVGPGMHEWIKPGTEDINAAALEYGAEDRDLPGAAYDVWADVAVLRERGADRQEIADAIEHAHEVTKAAFAEQDAGNGRNDPLPGEETRGDAEKTAQVEEDRAEGQAVDQEYVSEWFNYSGDPKESPLVRWAEGQPPRDETEAGKFRDATEAAMRADPGYKAPSWYEPTQEGKGGPIWEHWNDPLPGEPGSDRQELGRILEEGRQEIERIEEEVRAEREAQTAKTLNDPLPGEPGYVESPAEKEWFNAPQSPGSKELDAENDQAAKLHEARDMEVRQYEADMRSGDYDPSRDGYDRLDRGMYLREVAEHGKQAADQRYAGTGLPEKYADEAHSAQARSERTTEGQSPTDAELDRENDDARHRQFREDFHARHGEYPEGIFGSKELDAENDAARDRQHDRVRSEYPVPPTPEEEAVEHAQSYTRAEAIAANGYDMEAEPAPWENKENREVAEKGIHDFGPEEGKDQKAPDLYEHNPDDPEATDPFQERGPGVYSEAAWYPEQYTAMDKAAGREEAIVRGTGPGVDPGIRESENNAELQRWGADPKEPDPYPHGERGDSSEPASNYEADAALQREGAD